MVLLEYEKHMFLDLFHEDGIIVTARGLGIERLLLHFIELHCDPGNLVLVLNTSSQEENYLVEELTSKEVKLLPKVINNEYSIKQRQAVYLEGGVLFITSRILVVDLLTDRIPAHLISGILISKAHRVLNTYQEAFILRLYREKNKTGFIKAFSDQPQAFSSSFCQIDHLMKILFVRKLHLWPRFHASVNAFLEKHQPDVVELQLSMTPRMQAIQTSILDIISACLQEIKRYNPMLDADAFCVEKIIGRKSLDKLIKYQLDPVWHQLTNKTRQLVADLKLLCLLLQFLVQYDCITFYNYLNTFRSNEKKFGQNSGWLFLDASNTMFQNARDRIFGSSKNKKQKTEEGEKKEKVNETNSEDLELEPCPKWQLLFDTLNEIKEDSKTTGQPSRVLICASDDRTCSQLRDFLCDGATPLLLKLFNKHFQSKTSETDNEESANNKRKKDKKSKTVENPKKGDVLTLTQMMGGTTDNADNDQSPVDIEVTSFDAYYGILTAPSTVIHPLHGNEDPHNLTRTLKELQPTYVILYDAEIQFVRQLEIYKACRPSVPLRVYFLMYTGSTEEQRYLTTLQQEKDAFEHLIREKATMVIPEEVEGKGEIAPQLERAQSTEQTSSRKGGQTSHVQQKVIVDMREFRSELPSLLYKRGIDIVPVTIEVGDYILTPDICVERKSVSDLIGSLKSGRLYNQVVAMTRYYKRPVLLVEFDPNKSFSLQTRTTMTSETTYQNISSKLALLTLHFPALRILWCPSPHGTAELFAELKVNRLQPDVDTALAVTTQTDTDSQDAYNHTPYDMLLKMPGINTKNCWKLLKTVDDLSKICSMSIEELNTLLGSGAHAKLLHDFLHTTQAQGTTTSDVKKPSRRPVKTKLKK
ncbi:DNA repair endonuclease XPF-like isoform X2 [Anneissia japonica]|uniref:DNA repair endonuclease XPF-like isoform X2 n=1 Tax=Anneissia japonica TaxID=1529436 RepID=UPI0014258DDD|nr:DNA repair endonuclease XPF-like isoform X2 [Anneissia japonica]